MADKRPPLFGTPLSKSLENNASHQADDDDHIGPINRRRVRLEKQQIVTDDQGRRRFHGAFTGGFSAGHYNSVDTTLGFQPKSFISKRGHPGKRDGSVLPDHRPEDYMDDEDFGEFGIAPKKVRLAGEYSKDDADAVSNILRPVSDSIGERILRSMTGVRAGRPKSDENDIQNLLLQQKNDYHGLGYKPLGGPKVAVNSEDCLDNPLTATLKHGQRLKISGQAFGEGVIDDDDYASTNLRHADEYGIDTPANYDFSSKSSRHTREADGQQRGWTSSHQSGSVDQSSSEHYALDDFILAKDVESLDICGDEDYPRPVISADWKMPTREEPYVPPCDNASLENIGLFKKKAGKFSEKFVVGSNMSTVTKCDSIEGRAGLLQYSDIKLVTGPELPGTSGSVDLLASADSRSLTIRRQTLEWRPCSLLCKHFNVPNPYPGNAFCGVKQLESSRSSSNLELQDGSNSQGRTLDSLAPMQLRRSIFNVRSDETTQDADDELGDSSDDEKPQVIDLDDEGEASDHEMTRHEDQQVEDKESDTESDVVVVSPAKQVPEVITLVSSSSSSNDESDDDAYGPPLPPTRKTLQALSRSTRPICSASQSSTGGSSELKKRKRKKKKRH